MVKVFHSFRDVIHKSKNQVSIHSFMTQPEYAADDEMSQSFLNQEESPSLASKSRITKRLSDAETVSQNNTNNNAVDCHQVQIVASHPNSPLQSQETPV